MSKNTVILFVPGAWHPATSFGPTIKLLETAGYTCVPIALPTISTTGDSSFPCPDFSPDVSAIASQITKYSDQGSDVALVMHSYGGNPGSEACKGLAKSERQAGGKSGGVSHLIYDVPALQSPGYLILLLTCGHLPPSITWLESPSHTLTNSSAVNLTTSIAETCCASFCLPESTSLMDALGGNPLPWFRITEDQKIVRPATPKETFYNEIKDEKTINDLVASLGDQSYGAFATKLSWAAWKDIPSTYIYCEKDEAIPVVAQRGMVAKAKELGSKGWTEVSIDTDHTPFVGKAEETADAIKRSLEG